MSEPQPKPKWYLGSLCALSAFQVATNAGAGSTGWLMNPPVA